MWHENSTAASESFINLHRVYTGREWRDSTKYNTTYIIISDAVYTGWTLEPIYDVLTQSSNYLQCFVTSSVYTMWSQKHGKCEVKKMDTENRWFKCEWTEQFWVREYDHLCCGCWSAVSSVLTKGVNRMVRHDSISILITSDTIFADTSKNSTIRFDTGVYRSILSYYIPILNNHLHFY